MRRTIVPLIIALGLLAAACGGSESDGTELASTTTEASAVETTAAPMVDDEPRPLLVFAETGGCFMMGPNCSTTLVMSDGTFGVFRADPADVLQVPDDVATADIAGRFDATGLVELIAATDFDFLLAQLGPGTCQACFDGIDLSLRFETPSGPIEVHSTDYEFDASIALFAELALLRDSIKSAGELELKQRGG